MLGFLQILPNRSADQGPDDQGFSTDIPLLATACTKHKATKDDDEEQKRIHEGHPAADRLTCQLPYKPRPH
jgi:hypothetical protein